MSFPNFEEWYEEHYRKGSRYEPINAQDLINRVDEYEAAVKEYALRDYKANGEPLEIIQQFGTWAVTADGVECLQQYYVIEKVRLDSESWIIHLAEKGWVDMYDFLQAFYAGRHYHYPHRFPPLQEIRRNEVGTSYKPRRRRISTKKRFSVMKRDSYRCQVCGATAAGGALLEVDHKVPVSKGGTDHESNLWTLCKTCNLGKTNRNL